MIDRVAKALILILFVLGYSTDLSWAESMKLKYVASIYRDMQGRGLNRPEGVACNDQSVVIVADSGNDRLVRYMFQNDTLSGGEVIQPDKLATPLTVQMNSKGEIIVLDGKHLVIWRLGSAGQALGQISPKGLPPPSAFVPKSVALDRQDRIYVLDISAWRVLMLDPEGQFLKSFPFPAGQVFLGDLAVDATGRILLLDSGGAAVYALDPNTGESSILAGNLRTHMNWPKSITTDARGMIYLSDQHGGALGILGQDGTYQGSQLGPGWKESLLRYPSQVCINKKAEVFVADRENSRVQIFRTINP